MGVRRVARLPIIVVIGFALAVDYLVYGIVIPLTPFSPAGISKDEELAILTGCYGAGTLLTTPIFGYLGDRFGLRRPMIAGALLLAAATALLALAPNFGFMVAGRLLQGVAAAATWTAGLAIVAEHYSGNRVKMMGYALMGSTGGSVVGPILAGGLHAVGGYRLPFFAVIGVVAIELVACWIFIPNDARNVPPQANVVTLLRDRAVMIPAIAVVLAASAWTIVESLVPGHVARNGSNPAEIGLLFTLTTGVYGLSAPLVTWIVERLGMRRTAALGAISMGLAIPLVVVSDSIWWVGGVAALVNVAYAILLNPQSAAMGDAVENRGLTCYCAVYSVYNVAYSVGTIFTSMLASALLPHFSSFVVFICVGAVLILSTPILLASKPPQPAAAPDPATA